MRDVNRYSVVAHTRYEYKYSAVAHVRGKYKYLALAHVRYESAKIVQISLEPAINWNSGRISGKEFTSGSDER